MMNEIKTFVSTTFLGLPFVAWGGIDVLTLLILQILLGTKVIKVDFKYHRYLAWLLLVAAILHATTALIYVLA